MSNLPEDALLAMSDEAFNGWADGKQEIIEEIEALVDSKMKEAEVLRASMGTRRKELRAAIAARKAQADASRAAVRGASGERR